MYIPKESDTPRFYLRGKVGNTFGFKIEVQMVIRLNVVDRRVSFIDELEVDHLAARPNTGVEILIIEFERKTKLFGIERYAGRHIGRTQLRYNLCDRHV